jgi:hypothetical protein
MPQINTYADISAITQSIQEDAVFIDRDTNFMADPRVVTVYRDRTGMATRKNYTYNSGTAKDINEADDLTSDAFTPSELSTLTPSEIGEQFVLTDQRLETDPVGDIRNDASQELGFAARDKVESDMLGELANFTGGTIGAAGTTITWGHIYAGATVCRTGMKNRGVPLNCVLHEYQWHVLAKATSNAGLTLTSVPERLLGGGGAWYVGSVDNINFYATTNVTISSNSATGGIFARQALALDWRRPIRVEPQRDASRRAWELNMSGVYAHGVWRPTYGVTLIFAATAPTY